MKLAELSERSGVATATIKYYLRERLLPAGRRISATQAEYDEDHLRRLRLVRAMIQVGGMPVATAREVLSAVDDESLDHNVRLGAACGPSPTTRRCRRLTSRRRRRPERPPTHCWSGWAGPRTGVGRHVPRVRRAARRDRRMSRLGYPCDLTDLLPFGEAAGRLSHTEMDLIETYETQDGQLEAAVALTVLYEPVLLSLRRLAEAGGVQPALQSGELNDSNGTGRDREKALRVAEGLVVTYPRPDSNRRYRLERAAC